MHQVDFLADGDLHAFDMASANSFSSWETSAMELPMVLAAGWKLCRSTGTWSGWRRSIAA
jgi:hypothetical protein